MLKIEKTWLITVAALCFMARAEAQIIYTSAKAKKDTVEKFYPVDISPEPVGGIANFYKYLNKNFHLPQSAKDDKVSGRIIVSFVVEKDGSLKNAEVVKGLSPELNAEAIRVIENAPKWNPGIQNSHPVRVKYTLPVPVSAD